jgi:hypothetical protein
MSKYNYKHLKKNDFEELQMNLNERKFTENDLEYLVNYTLQKLQAAKIPVPDDIFNQMTKNINPQFDVTDEYLLSVSRSLDYQYYQETGAIQYNGKSEYLNVQVVMDMKINDENFNDESKVMESIVQQTSFIYRNEPLCIMRHEFSHMVSIAADHMLQKYLNRCFTTKRYFIPQEMFPFVEEFWSYVGHDFHDLMLKRYDIHVGGFCDIQQIPKKKGDLRCLVLYMCMISTFLSDPEVRNNVKYSILIFRADNDRGYLYNMAIFLDNLLEYDAKKNERTNYVRAYNRNRMFYNKYLYDNGYKIKITPLNFHVKKLLNKVVNLQK